MNRAVVFIGVNPADVPRELRAPRAIFLGAGETSKIKHQRNGRIFVWPTTLNARILSGIQSEVENLRRDAAHAIQTFSVGDVAKVAPQIMARLKQLDSSKPAKAEEDGAPDANDVGNGHADGSCTMTSIVRANFTSHKGDFQSIFPLVQAVFPRASVNSVSALICQERSRRKKMGEEAFPVTRTARTRRTQSEPSPQPQPRAAAPSPSEGSEREVIARSLLALHDALRRVSEVIAETTSLVLAIAEELAVE